MVPPQSACWIWDLLARGKKGGLRIGILVSPAHVPIRNCSSSPVLSTIGMSPTGSWPVRPETSKSCAQDVSTECSCCGFRCLSFILGPYFGFFRTMMWQRRIEGYSCQWSSTGWKVDRLSLAGRLEEKHWRRRREEKKTKRYGSSSSTMFLIQLLRNRVRPDWLIGVVLLLFLLVQQLRHSLSWNCNMLILLWLGRVRGHQGRLKRSSLADKYLPCGHCLASCQTGCSIS